GARLGGRDIAFDGAAHRSPEVRDPARRGLGEVLALDAAAEARRGGGIAAAARTARRTSERRCREELRTRRGHGRLGLAEGGLCGLEVLVRDVDLPLEAVEDGIVIDRPPGAAVDRVGRSALLPAFGERARLPGLLVDGRDRRIRALVIRPDRAAA